MKTTLILKKTAMLALCAMALANNAHGSSHAGSGGALILPKPLVAVNGTDNGCVPLPGDAKKRSLGGSTQNA